jgi:hypothetical protein
MVNGKRRYKSTGKNTGDWNMRGAYHTTLEWARCRVNRGKSRHNASGKGTGVQDGDYG